MEQVERIVVGGEKLIAVFGKWPSFHDAEVHELFLSRDDAGPDEERTPTCLIAKIHLWEMTGEVDSKGYYVLRNHTPALPAKAKACGRIRSLCKQELLGCRR